MDSVGAIILAAGGSSRFGQPKQLLVFEGESLVQRVVRSATEAGSDPVVVVVGDNRGQIETELRGTVAVVVQNRQWRQGLGTSIRSGLGHLLRLKPEVEAVVLLACDQPFVDKGIINSLILQRANSGKSIVASSYANTLGVPVLFERIWFDSLSSLPDDSGAKALIESGSMDVAQIQFPKGVIDIDTPSDFERLTRVRRTGAAPTE